MSDGCVFPGSHRLKESSSLPDIAEDLKSIKSALGIAADPRVDFILIRDDLVARQVTPAECCPDNFIDIDPVSAIKKTYITSSASNVGCGSKARITPNRWIFSWRDAFKERHELTYSRVD